jgi:hypothetical protein
VVQIAELHPFTRTQSKSSQYDPSSPSSSHDSSPRRSIPETDSTLTNLQPS